MGSRSHRPGAAIVGLVAMVMLLASCSSVVVVRQPPLAVEVHDDGGSLGPAHLGDAVGILLPPPSAAPVAAARGVVAVPILMFHYVRVDDNPHDVLGQRLSVTPDDFRQEMDLLATDGVHTITPAQLYATLNGGPPLPSRPVMLTFDDGYADFATTAAPILLAHHFTAVDYVVSGFIGRLGYMSATQVKLIDSEGFIVAAHTIHHVQLAKLPPALAVTEITGSKAALEKLLGHPVLDFAYPYGSVNPAVAAAVGAAGFRDAVTTIGGYTESAAQPFMWQRIEVIGGDSLLRFARKALLVH